MMKMEYGLKRGRLGKVGSLTGHVYLTDENVRMILDYIKWFFDECFKPAGGNIFIYLDPTTGARLYISVYLLFQEKNWLEKLFNL
jgi:hypothetical protein